MLVGSRVKGYVSYLVQDLVPPVRAAATTAPQRKRHEPEVRASAEPHNAIIVAADGSEVPDWCENQIMIDGAVLMPRGIDPYVEKVLSVARNSEDKFKSEDIADFCLVTLIGGGGWAAGRYDSRGAGLQSGPPG